MYKYEERQVYLRCNNIKVPFLFRKMFLSRGLQEQLTDMAYGPIERRKDTRSRGKYSSTCPWIFFSKQNIKLIQINPLLLITINFNIHYGK